jgi:hypothetical protein
MAPLGRDGSRLVVLAAHTSKRYRNLDLGRRLDHSSGMTIAEQVAQIDNSLGGAHLVLLDLASGHPVIGDSDAVKAALADLEAAREMLHGLTAGPGQN